MLINRRVNHLHSRKRENVIKLLEMVNEINKNFMWCVFWDEKEETEKKCSLNFTIKFQFGGNEYPLNKLSIPKLETKQTKFHKGKF